MGKAMNEFRVFNVRRPGNLAIGDIDTRPFPKFANIAACALLCASFICSAKGVIDGIPLGGNRRIALFAFDGFPEIAGERHGEDAHVGGLQFLLDDLPVFRR